MDFEFAARSAQLQQELLAFMDSHVYPAEDLCESQLAAKAARTEVAEIKVSALDAAHRMIDRALQAHGAAGVSNDTPLARMYISVRALRIADGPDDVHMRTVARRELAKYRA
jgi:alkylation response protein AidB-like acyl-CoA dehydrogenase